MADPQSGGTKRKADGRLSSLLGAFVVVVRKLWKPLEYWDSFLGVYERIVPEPVRRAIAFVLRGWRATLFLTLTSTLTLVLQVLDDQPAWIIFIGVLFTIAVSLVIIYLAHLVWTRLWTVPNRRRSTVIDRRQKQKKIDAWRAMLGDAVRESREGNDILRALSNHNDWYSLRAHMRPEIVQNLDKPDLGMRVAFRELSGAVPPEIRAIEKEISRIEREWGLVQATNS